MAEQPWKSAERLRALERMLETAHAAWPHVRLLTARFAEFVAERIPEGGDLALLEPHAADLYLACACAEGDRAALDGLEQGPMKACAAAAARVDRSPAFADEVKQALRQRLLSPEDGRPRILDYEGRAPLKSWLRAAAARTALNLTRGARASSGEEEALERATATQLDPELEYVQKRYRPQFAACLKEAMAALDARERMVLRLHVVEGAGVDGIARYYQVHRTTVTRWLQQARAQLVANTRQLLIQRLRVSNRELESLVRSLGSRLDFSISQILLPPERSRPPS
ncbi:MAG TPA: sigma-70 family RNA polymerase sigma factor, partial [Myxococcales bacterium]|nr:sigma-70 family RNA polymerase sigma factor [Myxococcales bacterium]